MLIAACVSGLPVDVPENDGGPEELGTLGAADEERWGRSTSNWVSESWGQSADP